MGGLVICARAVCVCVCVCACGVVLELRGVASSGDVCARPPGGVRPRGASGSC
jgi:hypothetical protein